MEAARSAVNKITSRTGHRTDVDENVMPSVTSETVKPHRHEETTEAVDREVHQHHYHTTVQPISHREQLPEQHSHNLAPQVNREYRHGNEAETQQRVKSELGQFQNTSTTHQTTQSASKAPTVAGEHVHHHVHETVQPVVHKETIQPEVVHTTIPIHETVHHKATHHGMSALPMKSLDDFKSSGGSLGGSQRSTTHEEYEGQPRPYNEKLTTTIDKVLPGHHHQSGNTTGNTLGNTTGQRLGEDTYGSTSTTGRHHIGEDSRGTLGSTGRMGEDTYGSTGNTTSHGLGQTSASGLGSSTGYGTGQTSGSGLGSTTSQGLGQTGSHGLGQTSRSNVGNTSTTTSTNTSTSVMHGSGDKYGEIGNSSRGAPGYPSDSGVGHQSSSDRNTSSGQQKSSGGLLNKLNPMTDSTGDGKTGFMK